MTDKEAAQIARGLLMRTDVGDLDAVTLVAAAILDAYRRGSSDAFKNHSCHCCGLEQMKGDE